jgi:hypothetical protein
MATKARTAVTVQLHKNNGSPQAHVFIAEGAKIGEVQAAVAGLYRDKLALKSVGLRFCEGCKSGLDIFIRTRFESQIEVPVVGF